MSTIPTRQIDGDVAVSRNVVTGGDATVRGSVNVGHDLRVEGWLDAPRMKVVCKGIFSSKEKLEHAYPSPLPGWYAGVCVGEKTELWLAVRELDEYRGAVWKRSSGAFVAVVDDTRYKEMVAEVEALRKEVSDGLGGLDSLRSGVNSARMEAAAAKTAAESAQRSATAAQGAAAEAMPRTLDIGSLDSMGVADVQAMKQLVSVRSGVMHTRYAVVNGGYVVGTLDVFSDNSRCSLTQVLETHHTLADDGSLDVTAHRDDKLFRYFRSFNFSAYNLDAEKNTWSAWKECVPEGVVRLGEDGKLPAGVMPGVRAVLGFGGTVSGVTVLNGSSVAEGQVVYDTERRRLLWCVGSGGITASGGGLGTYYCNWGNSTEYGEGDGLGVVPKEGVLYVDYVENLLYRWDGEELVALGSRMALGEGEADAYPGNLGAQNAEGLAEVREVVKEIYGTVMSCELPIDTLTAPGYYRLTNGVVLAVSKSANEVVNPTTAKWTVTQTMFAYDGVYMRSVEVVKSGRDVSVGEWSEWVNLLDKIPLASASENGLMSARDKSALDATFNSVMNCMNPIDTITDPGFYRTQYGDVLVVSKSPANGNQEETSWTVVQTLFSFVGIKTRSVEIVRRNLTLSKGDWTEWENRDEWIDRKMQRMREDIDSLKEIVGTLSGGGSGPVKVIRFDEDTGTLYI